jgi:ABC-type sugar transport system substrate-binding protein
MKKILVIVLIICLVFAIAACNKAPATDSSAAQAPAQDSSSNSSSNESSSAETAMPMSTETRVNPNGNPNLDPTTLKVAICQNEIQDAAGVHLWEAYEQSMEEFGITNYTLVDGSYDPVKQSQQILAAIQTKPDFILITPTDPLGITPAVKDVIKAEIPVFIVEGLLPEVHQDVTGWAISDQFTAGYATMDVLAQAMGGKGKLGMIWLDSQINWHLRDLGALAALKKYPDIEIVQEWSWDSTGVFTPRMAVDNFLTACPNVGDLTGIWSAWDGGVMEGIEACKAAGRTEILFAGINGQQDAIDAIMNGNQLVVSGGPMLYYEASLAAKNAVAYMKGEEITHTVYAPVCILTRESMQNAKLGSGDKLVEWDVPGNAEKWGLIIPDRVDPDTV